MVYIHGAYFVNNNYLPLFLSCLVTMFCVQGKPKREADADVGDVLSACAYFATLAEVQDRTE